MGRIETKSLFTDEEAEVAGGHIIRVAFESGVDREFDYVVGDEIWPVLEGQRVEVPFGRSNKHQIGFCVGSDISAAESFAGEGKGHRLKRVLKVVDTEPLLDSGLLELARWISQYYVCPLGQVLAAMVPAAVKKGAGIKREKYVWLAEGYQELVERLRGKRQKQIISALCEARAFGEDSAIEVDGLLGDIGCTKGPLKKLAEQQIVKMEQRSSLKSLPAIPEGMSLEAGEIELNEEQEKALAHIEGQIASGEFGVTLLHGVTDSGKTELYIRAIEQVIKEGKGAIVLLPEIALTAQTIERFKNRFENIAVMHSGLTGPQRNVQWQKIRTGEADVVIGARSAVFAPLPKLGLVVVDEEHEPSYKQDTVPRYSGRDVAIKRAQLCGAHCILGSATPSLETLFNSRSREFFGLTRLSKRVMDLPAPEMKLVDMRDGVFTSKGIDLLSEPLAEHLGSVLARGEQAILLLNRRGYSNFVFCPSCRHTLKCRNCDVSLTFHKSRPSGVGRMRTVTGRHMDYGSAVCHYCGSETLVPQKCPLCGKGIAMIGLGSQRLEEELAKKFPAARIARVDSDSMAGKDYYRILWDFSEGRINILAGTQMLAKGLHFPNVTLVGIISADTCLYLPDFRANERTFQLMSQVAGRAGRSFKKGTVIVQTFLPNQPAIQFALRRDFDGFIQEELKHRKACNLPPYWRLAVVVMRDRDFEKLEEAARLMRERIDELVIRYNLKVKVRGPMPAVISRIQRFHRIQIIVQSPGVQEIQKLFARLRGMGPVRPAVRVAVDIDPVNLL